MNHNFLACSKCGEVMLKGLGSEVKIRAKILVMKDEMMYAVCKGCDSEIPVPLVFDSNLAKSLVNSYSEPKLYLKR